MGDLGRRISRVSCPPSTRTVAEGQLTSNIAINTRMSRGTRRSRDCLRGGYLSGVWSRPRPLSIKMFLIAGRKKKQSNVLDIQGIEPWTSRMRSVRATTVPNALSRHYSLTFVNCHAGIVRDHVGTHDAWKENWCAPPQCFSRTRILTSFHHLLITGLQISNGRYLPCGYSPRPLIVWMNSCAYFQLLIQVGVLSETIDCLAPGLQRLVGRQVICPWKELYFHSAMPSQDVSGESQLDHNCTSRVRGVVRKNVVSYLLVGVQLYTKCCLFHREPGRGSFNDTASGGLSICGAGALCRRHCHM